MKAAAPLSLGGGVGKCVWLRGCGCVFLGAQVTLGDGPAITKIALKCVGVVPGCDAKKFQETALKAKEGCPISKALAGVATITLDAKLEN